MFSCFSMFPRSFKKPMVLALGDCIPVRPWSDSPIACLAELRMVWRDKSEQCLLTSLRLYFLPENTPMGRYCHGEVSTMHQCSMLLLAQSSSGYRTRIIVLYVTPTTAPEECAHSLWHERNHLYLKVVVYARIKRNIRVLLHKSTLAWFPFVWAAASTFNTFGVAGVCKYNTKKRRKRKRRTTMSIWQERDRSEAREAEKLVSKHKTTVFSSWIALNLCQQLGTRSLRNKTNVFECIEASST